MITENENNTEQILKKLSLILNKKATREQQKQFKPLLLLLEQKGIIATTKLLKGLINNNNNDIKRNRINRYLRNNNIATEQKLRIYKKAYDRRHFKGTITEYAKNIKGTAEHKLFNLCFKEQKTGTTENKNFSFKPFYEEQENIKYENDKKNKQQQAKYFYRTRENHFLRENFNKMKKENITIIKPNENRKNESRKNNKQKSFNTIKINNNRTTTEQEQAEINKILFSAFEKNLSFLKNIKPEKKQQKTFKEIEI